MNIETAKPRLESEESKIRLIDANALIEELLCSIYKTGFGGDGFKAGNEFGIRLAIESVESAPTVETTDDVWARLPEGVTVRKLESRTIAYEKKTFGKQAYGKTPPEAVKKLDESLNRK